MSETLLDRAKSNYGLAKIIFSNRTDDPICFNGCGYFLQQSLEVYLKHYLEIEGVNYPKTHSISDLLALLDKCDIKLPISEELQDEIFKMSGTFTQWESQTRYIKDYFLAKREVLLGFKLMSEILGLPNPESSSVEINTSVKNQAIQSVTHHFDEEE